MENDRVNDLARSPMERVCSCRQSLGYIIVESDQQVIGHRGVLPFRSRSAIISSASRGAASCLLLLSLDGNEFSMFSRLSRAALSRPVTENLTKTPTRLVTAGSPGIGA